MDVPEGWVTDLAVLRLSGAVIEEHPDHLVVTSPHNPGYHWGNFVLVTDPDAADDLPHWVEVFDEHHPDAAHVALGLPREPDPTACREVGLEREVELVLDSRLPVQGPPCPPGYLVRALEAGDWDLAAEVDRAEMVASGHSEGPGERAFVHGRVRERAELARRGVAVFLGAFDASGSLAAQVGIVLCGPRGGSSDVARYQHVGTVPGHRSRGLAGHLLGVAGEWAAGRGADRWEIHVDPGTAAHRLYDRLGFQERTLVWQAYRLG